MSWKLDQVVPLWSDGLQPLLVCSAAFICYTLSRLVAAHAAESVLEEVLRLSTSPLEATAAVVLALCLLGYSAGYSRVLQLLTASQLKIIGAVLAVRTATHLGAPAARAATAQLRAGAQQPVAPTAAPTAGLALPSSPATPGGASPRKDVGSHRLSERRGRSPGKHKHRWSFDVAPSSGPRKEHLVAPAPRQRAASADHGPSARPAAQRHECEGSDSSADASPTIAAALQPPFAGGSSSPAVEAPGRRQWQPAMQRIASGQQLLEFAAPPRRSLDNTRPLPSAASPQPLPASAFAPSNMLRCEDRSSPLQPPSTLAEVSAAAAAASAEAAAPASPTNAALAMTTWVYSRTLVSLSSWASSTVDSYLRPLLPGAPAPPEAAAGGLQRAQSAPVPRTSRARVAPAASAAMSTAAAGAAATRTSGACCAAAATDRATESEAVREVRLVADLRRRASEDGGECSYSGGAVAADPARRERLEQYACAARQQCPPHASSTGVAPLCAAAGLSAVASAGLDGECAQEIRELVTDEHLLQFGAALGEEAALTACAQLGLPEPLGTESSLFGPSDSKSSVGDEWEQIVDESVPGLHYCAWRKPLRRGLYVYRSSAVVAGVAPRELRAFHLDDDVRALWDETVMSVERLPPANRGESCLHRFLSRFPRPMAPRLYHYARRVWHRPSDGGCYIICRSAPALAAGGAGGPRGVAVQDFVSGVVVRAAEGGAELVTIYFDDAQVRPGLAKMAVPKGLWPFIQKYEAALRTCLERPDAAAACRGRVVVDGAQQEEGGQQQEGLAAAPGGRRLRGAVAWRRGRGGAARPSGGKKLVRNLVLATGIKIMYDLMVRR